jgi:hypothetical protein
MIKKAVLVSGIPKYWEKGLKSIKHWFNDADIFIHTWDTSFITIDKTIAYNPSTYSSDIETCSIIKHFDPKKFLIEKLEDKKQSWIERRECYKKNNIVCAESISPFSMFYSIKQANNLKKEYEQENNFLYDVAIRIRFDSDIQTFKPEELYIKDRLFIPAGHDNSFCGVNDQFFFGDTNIMNEACNMYDSFDLICNEIQFFLPEACFGVYLKKIGVSDKIIRNNITVNINNG